MDLYSNDFVNINQKYKNLSDCVFRGDTCTVTILKRTKVSLGDTFALGYYDELKINGVRIRTKSAVDTILNKGTVISWVASTSLRSSSQFDPKNGWQMCFGEDTHSKYNKAISYFIQISTIRLTVAYSAEKNSAILICFVS